jgi:hypothetical protein
MRNIIIIIIIIIFINIFINIFYFSDNYENFRNENENFSWNKKWSKMDRKVRENKNCNPIKITNLHNYKIWTMPQSCEDGLPHTRYKDVIAMPENYSGDYNNTIEHELIHLHQRKNLNKWYDFYSKYWNFEIYPEKNIPSEFIDIRRSNPDTIDSIWVVYLKKWLIIPIYNEENTIKNASIIYYNIHTKEKLIYPPQEFTDFFGYTPQSEHPHEISANYIVSYIKKNKISSKAMQLLIDRWDFKKKDFII